MNEIPHKIGNIYQIDPSKSERWKGQFIVATEIKLWGVQGYLLLDHPDNGQLVRCDGLAFIRMKYEEIVCVGFAEWTPRHVEE